MIDAIERRRDSIVLGITAAFALVWAVARVSVQAITIDEADTYLAFAAPPWPSHWYPASNNHVLNSMLMRLFTLVFGASPLSVRAPALIGAVLYIAAACWLSMLVADSLTLRWPLFVCLVYNPFVFDYLVAARGYGLATAFLMLAIAVPAFQQLRMWQGRPASPARACALSSIFAALSFAANFSFALADAAAVFVAFVWVCRGSAAKMPAPRPFHEYGRLLAACTLPGFGVALFLTAQPIAHFPKSQLWYGATRLTETLNSIVEASLYELNPQLVNTALMRAVTYVPPFLFPLLAAFCALKAALVCAAPAALRDPRARWLTRLGAALLAVAVLTATAHWISYRAIGVLLPKERTGLFFVPLLTLAAGAAAALPVPSRAARFAQRGVIATIFAVACYFLLCLRLTYFKEWKYDADVRSVYSVLSYYNHRYGFASIPSHWRYVAALNYYRVTSGREAIDPFVSARPYPPDRPAYVLFFPEDRQFIAQHGLKIVYRGEMSEVVVAVDPAAERAQRAGAVP